MKKIHLVTVAALASLVVGGTAFAAPVTPDTKSEADINLVETEDNDNTLLEPENPDREDEIFPEDPTEDKREENKGPLTIDYVSNFRFGQQKISGNNNKYFANPVTIYETEADRVAETNPVIVPNYIQVSDNRGTNVGWTLKVQQTKAFTVNGQDVAANDNTGLALNGAKLSIKNLNAFKRDSNQGILPNVFATGKQVTVANGESAVLFASAQKDQGTGSMAILAGNVKGTDTASQSVELAVPGHIKKQKEKTYKAELTWILETEPSVNP